jgi:hypothetical protein
LREVEREAHPELGANAHQLHDRVGEALEQRVLAQFDKRCLEVGVASRDGLLEDPSRDFGGARGFGGATAGED